MKLGLYKAWEQYGVLSWDKLVTPSALLAENWIIDIEVGFLLTSIKPQLLSGLYPELSALYLNKEGNIKITGDTVQQPALSRTLHNIATHGPDYLYVTMASTLAAGEYKTFFFSRQIFEILIFSFFVFYHYFLVSVYYKIKLI